MKISDPKIFSDQKIREFINQNDYASAAIYLFNSQLNNWELLKRNYEALKNVETKSFCFEGFKLKIQYNPERIRSTSAIVDEKSIANRPCFLCVNNLPEEQKGILLSNNFILLCNPYPIFPEHFTIAAISHIPQRISDHFSDFLDISNTLSPKYNLIYNGPACGASAPDHLHFQAGTKNFMPIENDIQQLKNDYGISIINDELITISFINDGLRRIIFIESTAKTLIEKNFKKILNIYEEFSKTESEPMLNLISSYNSEFGWSLIIFLRSKHRPGIFFKDDPDKILISPAAIDMGGLIIAPRKEDFNKINEKLLQKIIDEVSINSKTFDSILKLFKQS